MDNITVKGYRSFRERQSARLAPLTLLVGNNSTGKTSFLALIRALWDVAFLSESPDFQKDPYDLGTFRDIAHNRGGRAGRVRSFEAAFEYSRRIPRSRMRRTSDKPLLFSARFEERVAVPFPVERRINQGTTSVEAYSGVYGQNYFQFETSNVCGKYHLQDNIYAGDEVRLIRFSSLSHRLRFIDDETDALSLSRGNLDDAELRQISDLVRALDRRPSIRTPQGMLPFASAPVRSRPSRTYDPIRPSQDAEGGYIPTYLANLSRSNQEEWERLKDSLEEFGKSSGLFDEITIKTLGRSEGAPFQVQIRKFSGRRKGALKNLIDVGYGVSQALPVITELLRSDSSQMFLLQQPEVHLHPSAQAALGSLFCNIAAEGRKQIIVETHSDHLLDRVRIDTRDGKTGLKPEDVSILFFEEGELDVNIHSIRLDKNGNVLDAPPSYRQFFMEETRSSIGL